MYRGTIGNAYGVPFGVEPVPLPTSGVNRYGVPYNPGDLGGIADPGSEAVANAGSSWREEDAPEWFKRAFPDRSRWRYLNACERASEGVTESFCEGLAEEIVYGSRAGDVDRAPWETDHASRWRVQETQREATVAAEETLREALESFSPDPLPPDASPSLAPRATVAARFGFLSLGTILLVGGGALAWLYFRRSRRGRR
jgi:hypothetical protein